MKWHVVDSISDGVPCHRSRVFVVGVRKSIVRAAASVSSAPRLPHAEVSLLEPLNPLEEPGLVDYLEEVSEMSPLPRAAGARANVEARSFLPGALFFLLLLPPSSPVPAPAPSLQGGRGRREKKSHGQWGEAEETDEGEGE